MEDVFRCKICHELYDNSSHKPLILPCGHTLCEYCLKIIIKSNQIKCPFDKKVHSFNERHEITVNYQLIDLFNIEEVEKNIAKCITHSNQIIRFYCEIDKKALCQFCLLEEHLGPDHKVIAIKEVISLENFKSNTENFLTLSKKSLEKSKEMSMEIEENFNTFKWTLTKMRENLLKTLELTKAEILKENSEVIIKERTELEKHQSELLLIKEINEKNLTELELLNEIEIDNSEKYNEMIEKSQYNNIKEPIRTRNKLNPMILEEPVPLLTKNRKIAYMKAQLPNFDSKNNKMLKTLKEKQVLQSEEVKAAMINVNQRNYVKSEDKTIVFEDIYKPMKYGYNYVLPSPCLICKLLEEVKPIKKSNIRALEMGTGSGYITALLTHLIGKKGRLISVENNENLMNIAKTNIQSNNSEIYDQIEFQCKDYKNLVFPAKSFDIIIISVTLQNFPIEFEEMLALNGIMWVSIGSIISKRVSCYVFEKDSKGEVRSRKVEILESTGFNMIF